MTWNQAVMCLSELGDLVSKPEPSKEEEAQHPTPDSAALFSSVESLVDVVRGTQPATSTSRTADVGLLGAGLVTSSQLMMPMYGSREMRKRMQQQAHRLQDVLVSQSREYLASHLPDASKATVSTTSLQEPAQSLLVVRPLTAVTPRLLHA
jgi:hypothetical protein